MRPRAYTPMLAAALILATTSPAYATEFISNGGGNGNDRATIAGEHHSTDPAGWTRGIVGAGGFTYAGGGNHYPTLAPASVQAHGHRLNHRQTV